LSLGTILLIVLIIILLGGFSGVGGGPFYGTGYYGGGGLGLIVVILLILVVFGRILIAVGSLRSAHPASPSSRELLDRGFYRRCRLIVIRPCLGLGEQRRHTANRIVLGIEIAAYLRP